MNPARRNLGRLIRLLITLCLVGCRAWILPQLNDKAPPPARARYNDIVALDTNCDANSTYAVWQPLLQVRGGSCPSSFPAVSIDGTISRGLVLVLPSLRGASEFLVKACQHSLTQIGIVSGCTSEPLIAALGILKHRI